MDTQSSVQDPTLAQAAEALSRHEKAIEADLSEAHAIAHPGSTRKASATPGERAPEAPKAAESDPSNPSKPATEQPGAPATAKPTDTEKPTDSNSPRNDKGQFTKPDDNAEPKSAYAKSQKRLEGGWEKFNAERDAFTKEKDSTTKALAAERQKLEAERLSFAQEQQKAKAATQKPAQFYLDGAKALEAEAEGLEFRARKLEDQGEFDKSELATKAAMKKRALAEQSREHADYLRQNPPAPDPTAQELAAKHEASVREWLGKAAQDFPAASKAGTPESNALIEFCEENPGIAHVDKATGKPVIDDPAALYFATRLVSAEIAAASASKLKGEYDKFKADHEKELTELRAKLKDANEKLQPGGGGIVPRAGTPDDFNGMSLEAQENYLRAEAKRASF